MVRIREEISQTNIDAKNPEIRKFRNSIIGSDREHHKRIVSSNDFYSLSTVRDLLFHVQEHRFTIPTIKDCLAELRLEFCGFENLKIVEAFKSEYRNSIDLYDLNKWHMFEESNPRAFSGMYQFWCQEAT